MLSGAWPSSSQCLAYSLRGTRTPRAPIRIFVVGSSWLSWRSGACDYAFTSQKDTEKRTSAIRRCAETGWRKAEATLGTYGEHSSTSSCFKVFSLWFATLLLSMFWSTRKANISSGSTSWEYVYGFSASSLNYLVTCSSKIISQTKRPERKSSSILASGGTHDIRTTSAKWFYGGVYTWLHALLSGAGSLFSLHFSFLSCYALYLACHYSRRNIKAILSGKLTAHKSISSSHGAQAKEIHQQIKAN